MWQEDLRKHRAISRPQHHDRPWNQPSEPYRPNHAIRKQTFGLTVGGSCRCQLTSPPQAASQPVNCRLVHRDFEATAPLSPRDTRDCRNRDNQIVDTSRESLFALRSILHQVSDYEAILLYLQPPHWHLPGDLSLPTIAEFAHCLHKNLEIEQLRQSHRRCDYHPEIVLSK